MQGEKKFLYAALVLGFFNLLALILGLIRDRLLASQIGPGEILDTYYAAFKIPDTIHLIMMSVISTITIVPIFARLIREENFKKVGEMFSTLILFVSGILIFFAFAMYFLIPHVLDWYVPGFSLSQKEMLIQITRVLMLQPVFLATSYIVGSMLQVKEKFFYFSLAPVLYNLGGIIGVSVLYPIYGLTGLGMGIVIGAILHLSVNLYGLRRVPEKVWAGFNFSFAHVRDIAVVAGPRSITLGVQQLRLLTFATAGSLLPAGAISIYNLSYNLYWIPVSIIVMSYLVTIYPKLSVLDKRDELSSFVSNIVNYFIFILMPIICFGFVLRAYIVRIVYGTGVFDWQATRLIAATFAVFLFVLIFDALRRLFSRILFARGIVWAQFFIEVVLLILQSLIFIFAFRHVINFSSPFLSELLKVPATSIDIIGLALIFFILAFVELVVLYFFVRRHVDIHLSQSFFHTIFASLGGAIISYTGLNLLEWLSKIN
jgi:putative peptidoglycan lipid II flippase